MLEAVIQVVGAFILTFSSGAAAYQIRNNAAVHSRLNKVEDDVREANHNLVKINDVLISQLATLNEKVSDTQAQRLQAHSIIEQRFSHLDNLVSSVYEILLEKKNL